MKERFAKLKECIKNFFKGMFQKDKSKALIRDHAEEFEFFVKYYPVFVKLVKSVSDREIECLNSRNPCKYRVNGEKPFRLNCALKINGESEKRISDCETCSYRE